MSQPISPWIEILSEEWSGPVRLRIQGQSMRPALEPGDEVTVEPLPPKDLRPGDWVVMRRADAMILHRFLAVRGDGRLLTKGDRLRRPDPPWPPEALVGRVVAHSRQEQSFPVSPPSLWGRVCIRSHRLLASFWPVLHRLRRLLPLLGLLFCALPAAVWAAVTLLSFAVAPADNGVLVTWETGSEIDMLGFYIWRSPTEVGNYQRISDLILAQGDPLVGLTYQYLDSGIAAGTYYYKLEAMEISGAGSTYGPISITLAIAPTATPTDTPSPTPTLTPSSTPSSTPSPTPTFSPSSAPAVTPSATPSPTPSPLQTFTPEPSATPSLTSGPSATYQPASAVSSGTPTWTPRLVTASPLTASPLLATSTSLASTGEAPSPMLTSWITSTVTAGARAEQGTLENPALPEPPLAHAAAASEREAPTHTSTGRSWIVVGLRAAMGVELAVIVAMLILVIVVGWRRLRRE